MAQHLTVVDIIARHVDACWLAFEGFSSALRQFPDAASLSFSSRDVDDAFEQYRVLVRNVSARAIGNVSLDFRLRDS